MKLRMVHLAFSLLIFSQFQMLTSLNSQSSLRTAVGLNVFKPQHNHLCSFSLFAENQLSLTTVATLLPVVMSRFLHIQRILVLLCHLVRLVLATLLTLSAASFRNVYHVGQSAIGTERCGFVLKAS